MSVTNPVYAAVAVGDSPALDFISVSGTKVDRQYLKGKLVVVDFWASWCPACISTLPIIKTIHSKYDSLPVVILGINSDTNVESMSKAIESQNIGWLQYYDQGGKTGKLWGIPGLPAVYLLSPQGKVLWTGSPAGLNWSLARAMQKFFGNDEMLTDLKKKTRQALADAAHSLNSADYPGMLRAFRNMESGAVEDVVIFKESELLFNKIKMIQDKERVGKIQEAVQADSDGGRAFINMLVAIDQSLQARAGQKADND